MSNSVKLNLNLNLNLNLSNYVKLCQILWLILVWISRRTRPAWAGFKTAEEGRAYTPFGVGEPCGPRGEVNPQK